jgi:type II secretory pathway component PulJ
MNKDMLTIAIFSLITVVAWIAFDVYHAATESTITEVQSQLVAPLTPQFDKTALEQIRVRGK